MNGPSSRPELAALRLGDTPGRWRALGFTVVDGSLHLGGVRIELGAAGRGIVGWRLRGLQAPTPVDGLPTEVESAPQPGLWLAEPHPNGAIGLDHVVVTTPDFDRTAAALVAVGLPLSRVRQAAENVRQGFRRVGPAILELVEAPDPDPGPARFWGLVVILTDLAALAERLGDRLGAVKQAVQPGRQIATLRRSAGLGEAVAFMSPEPARPP